jgi:hypothetical protein
LAVVIRILSLGIEAACVDEPKLNAVQYLYPLAVAGVAIFMLRGGKRAARRSRPASAQRSAMAMG